MAKDIRLESFKYHFLISVERLELGDRNEVRQFLEKLDFIRTSNGVTIRWDSPIAGELEFSFSDFTFYRKGDTPRSAEKQRKGLSSRPIEFMKQINLTREMLH